MRARRSKVLLKLANRLIQLQLQTAPVLFLFHPTTGPNAVADGKPVRFDFATGTDKAEPIHAWITRQLPNGPHPPIVRPVNYTRIIILTTSVLGMSRAKLFKS